MSKKPKTVGEMIDVLSKYNKDYPLRIELIENKGRDFLHSKINDVYRGENIITEEETVFIRFEY